MEYFVKSGNPEKQRVACVIVGVYDRRTLSEDAETIDKASEGLLGSVLRRGDMDGKLGSTLLLHNVPGIFADRVLLVGLGKERDFGEAEYRKAIKASAEGVKKTGSIDAVNFLTHLAIKGHDFAWNIAQAVLVTEEVYYRFDECKGSKAREDIQPDKLERYTFDLPRRSDLPAGEKGLLEALAMVQGVNLTKRLANLPGNLCTPTFLAETALKLAADYPTLLTCKVLEEADMAALGMGALLSVSRGSRQPAKLILLEYKNAGDDKPLALVGKGLTFDAGGISIKPGDKMDEMKFDMCGGASVLGTFKALLELKLPLNVVGAIPATENLPDGDANKPGDIVTSMAGITIEVLNTDAEGRLILADALTYVEKTYDPSYCIDIATLTGACVVALGNHASGLFSNHSPLGRALVNAGEAIGDRAWELPLWPEYDQQIKSPFADVANINTSGTGGGSCTAAAFLHRFTKKMKWAHMDIAGSAWVGKKATGRPVPLLTQFLIQKAAKVEE